MLLISEEANLLDVIFPLYTEGDPLSFTASGGN